MKRILFLCIFAFFVIFATCTKQELINGTWQVENFKSHADSALQYPSVTDFGSQETYTLTFRNRYNYTFKLTLAECNGTIKFKTNHGISFEAPDCTFVGGDSEVAYKVEKLLWDHINHYEVSNNKLILTGDNGETITLIKQE